MMSKFDSLAGGKTTSNLRMGSNHIQENLRIGKTTAPQVPYCSADFN